MASTQSETAFQLTQGAWQVNQSALTAVRCAVFVDEQGVPESLELDDHDAGSHHILVCDRDDKPIGAGRIKPDGQIGRMAVLKAWRGQGVGSAILAALLEHARQQGYARVFLYAQASAVSFYERSGFETHGENFEVAGIQHRRMEKSLE